jgi:hypothetical protein
MNLPQLPHHVSLLKTFIVARLNKAHIVTSKANLQVGRYCSRQSRDSSCALDLLGTNHSPDSACVPHPYGMTRLSSELVRALETKLKIV